ncbi:MAG TPA: class I SAM-dependent methyltransferase [Xanthobacteraceae bacterium]|nr:class I SAM-dependent methyltransferase [Xanthobacteraceae bacterium]
MDKNKVKAFADKVFTDMAGAMTAGMAYVGTKTGLFRVMAGKGPMRLEDLVGESGLNRRYVEEWLKGMTCAEYLEYDPIGETYRLPDEQAFLLASDDTDHFMGGLFGMAPVLLRVASDVATAFVRGGGVRFEEFGPDGVVGLDLINRGQYEQRLTSYWLKTLPPVMARLQTGARALDVGCGAGRVCIAIARDFPQTEVIGIDPDPESIRQARAAAAAAGVAERITFLAATADDLDRDKPFDLITVFDCIHDFAAPQRTLEQIRALLKPDGTLFIVEPKAADRLEDNINPIATMLYGFSLFHCMTQSLANGGPGLGTCLGPVRTQALVDAAGFRSFEQLDIKSPVNLFYAARP